MRNQRQRKLLREYNTGGFHEKTALSQPPAESATLLLVFGPVKCQPKIPKQCSSGIEFPLLICFTGFTRYLEEYVLVSVGERNMRSRYNEFFRHDMMRIHLMGWKNARCGHDHLFRQIVFVVHAPRGLSASCPQLYFFCQRWDLS